MKTKNKHTNLFRYFLLSSFITILFTFSHAQELTQTIRGVVLDKVSQMPLPGASVVLLHSEPLKGATTGSNGQFRIEKVAVGRQSIQVSFMGYVPAVMNNLTVSSAKELILTIEMEENVITTKEVVVEASRGKDKATNEMALISARSFTVEETNRYAGSWGDPARMVANYAGVIPVSDERNDIIIRGNSPIGVLWRLDGVEIPNPNHFGALGTTGGPITILNNNLLTNSDFYTGAFPAEFGNALSGAFDLKMRTGNNEKREYWGQMGFNGFELGTEGPFRKDSTKHDKATYLASYRYSMLDALKTIGFDMGISPKYQDLTFKIDFPGTRCGHFSLFGIGGISYIEMLDSKKDSTEWTYAKSGEDLTNGSDMGAIGLSHQYFINEKIRIVSHLSLLASRVSTKIDTFDLTSEKPFPWFGETSSEIKYSASSHLKIKINTKNNIGTGVFFDTYHLNYQDSVYSEQTYRKITEMKGNMSILKMYGQWKHRFSDKVSISNGIHFLHLVYNNTSAIEPRMALKWIMINNHSLNLGIGMHSQIQPRMIYFTKTLLPDHTYIETNKQVDLSRSIHSVLGYDFLITENLRFKSEIYYQRLYNLPVSKSNPTYSIINSGADFYISRVDSLENKGTGENYGLEITFEKFLSRQYYFLITATLFESTYKGYDNIKRNTAFNGNYVFNVLGGYEIKTGKNNLLALDIKTIYAGGKRYIPVNVEQSIAQHEVIYDYSRSFEKKYDDYMRIDFRISFRLNSRRVNQEWALDLENISNNKNIFMEHFDVTTGESKNIYQIGFFPMMTWRIQF